MKRGCFLLLLLALLVLPGCARQESEPVPGGETELIYQERCFWMAEEFPVLSEDYLETLFFVEYNVSAGEFNITFDQKDNSTVLECRIYGKIGRDGDDYRADFSWLLDPLGLDFLDDNFTESTTGLSWEGNIGNVATSILIECPEQDSVYQAWEEPVGHCHAHIWWPASSGGVVKCTVTQGKGRLGG